MRQYLLTLKPFLIVGAVGTILTFDLSNQWEVPVDQLPSELYQRHISKLKADGEPADILALANNGNAQAQYIYALRHTSFAPTDLMIKNDPAVAYAWMTKAAENRHARAMGVVALYHLKAIGTPKDDAKAKEWASRAADKGQPMGCRVLGDLEKAAADSLIPLKGTPDFELRQAKYEATLASAFIQYRRGAEAGDRHCLRELAKAYDSGLPGHSQNYRLATEYLTRAAIRRDVKATRALTERHEMGLKTPVDLGLAYAWRLVLIALEPNPDDQARLAALEKLMKPAQVQAGQDLATQIIRDLPTEVDDALARLNQGR